MSLQEIKNKFKHIQEIGTRNKKLYIKMWFSSYLSFKYSGSFPLSCSELMTQWLLISAHSSPIHLWFMHMNKNLISLFYGKCQNKWIINKKLLFYIKQTAPASYNHQHSAGGKSYPFHLRTPQPVCVQWCFLMVKAKWELMDQDVRCYQVRCLFCQMTSIANFYIDLIWMLSLYAYLVCDRKKGFSCVLMQCSPEIVIYSRWTETLCTELH